MTPRRGPIYSELMRRGWIEVSKSVSRAWQRASRLPRILAPLAFLASPWIALHAQQPPSSERAVNWERARQAISKYRPIIDNSGLVEVDAADRRVGGSPRIFGALCEREARAPSSRRRRLGIDALDQTCRPGTTPSPTSSAPTHYRLLGISLRRSSRRSRRCRRSISTAARDAPDAIPEGLSRSVRRNTRCSSKRRPSSTCARARWTTAWSTPRLTAACSRCAPAGTTGHRRRGRRARRLQRLPER